MLDTVQTQSGAKTMTMDPSTHELFLVTANARRGKSGVKSKGEITPGTFTMLRFAPGAGERRLRAATTPASLVVLIAIDQMRPDYFERWRSQLTGGSGRIRAHGRILPERTRESCEYRDGARPFDDALGTRAHTHRRRQQRSRCSGSALAIDQRERARRIAAPFSRHDALRLDAVRDPRSRVLSVSRKDRGAILPVGRAKGSVFW